MRTGRTYEVFVNGKPAGLVGSTVRTLKERRRGGYVKRFGSSVELRLIREITRHESEDDVSYNFHLKAAEALDIARKKTYSEDGGLNRISPLVQALGSPMLEAEKGRIGGPAGGRRRFELHGSPATLEGCRKGAHNQSLESKAAGGRIGGCRAFELHGNPATFESRSHAGQIGSRIQSWADKRRGFIIGLCKRWNINRGKLCTCGVHQ